VLDRATPVARLVAKQKPGLAGLLLFWWQVFCRSAQSRRIPGKEKGQII